MWIAVMDRCQLFGTVKGFKLILDDEIQTWDRPTDKALKKQRNKQKQKQNKTKNKAEQNKQNKTKHSKVINKS